MTIAVSDIKDITLVLTSMSTVLISFLTIKKWKTEYKGKAYFDAAMKFKKTAYNLRNNFLSLRVDFISPLEMHPEFNPREEQKSEHEAYVINSRYQLFKGAVEELYNIKPEMEAYFGTTATDLCNNLNGIVSQYLMAVNSYLQLVGNTNNFDHLGSIRKQIYSSNKDDPMQNEMDTHIKKIEALVERYTQFRT